MFISTDLTNMYVLESSSLLTLSNHLYPYTLGPQNKLHIEDDIIH